MREKDMNINLITYNAAITALAKAARKNSKDFRNLGIKKLEKVELWPKALSLLNRMKEDGIQPDGFCYSSAISCCGAEGRWLEACDLLETMKKGGPKTRPNKIAYTAAIGEREVMGSTNIVCPSFLDKFGLTLVFVFV